MGSKVKTGGLVGRAGWRVAKTGESSPDYQYRIIRTLPDGSVETYRYADTREEAAQLLCEASSKIEPAKLVGRAVRFVVNGETQ